MSAQPAPRQNLLLAALPPGFYENLLPALEFVPLQPGWVLHATGDRDEHLYFLTEGIVFRFRVTANGESAAFAVTGNEGVIGIASYLGGERSLSRVVALSPGYAYRLKAHLLANEIAHHSLLLNLLLRYTQALIVQTGQVAVCNRHHTVEQQLCRWILSCMDRLPSAELTLTQELIADILGVRRASVTEAAGKLQAAGLVHWNRGHVTVLNRTKLETQACECYALIKKEYDRLLPRRIVPEDPSPASFG